MKKSDIILTSLILLAVVGFALFYFFAPSSGDGVAVISVNGETVREISLSSTEDIIFTLTEVPASFEVKSHKIRFVNVDCPDHLCENTGFVSRVGESAICMPNKTSLVIR